jgi:hypothetical protein
MTPSRNGAATIDPHRRTDGEGCRDKEHHRIRDILRLADSARRQALRRAREHRIALVQSAVGVRLPKASPDVPCAFSKPAGLITAPMELLMLLRKRSGFQPISAAFLMACDAKTRGKGHSLSKIEFN